MYSFAPREPAVFPNTGGEPQRLVPSEPLYVIIQAVMPVFHLPEIIYDKPEPFNLLVPRTGVEPVRAFTLTTF